MTKHISPEEFNYSYGHIKVKFEKFHRGWITFVSEPHTHTKRVFRVITGYSAKLRFHRDQDFTVSWFGIDGDDTWGEIYLNDELVESCQDT